MSDDLKELYEVLNESEYPVRVDTELENQCKQQGIVIAFPQSDDLIEFLGAIDDETGHGPVMINEDGIIKNECDDERCPNFLRIFNDCHHVWCEYSGGFQLHTDVKNAVAFSISEDGDFYGSGIVFRLEDLSQAIPNEYRE